MLPSSRMSASIWGASHGPSFLRLMVPGDGPWVLSDLLTLTMPELFEKGQRR